MLVQIQPFDLALGRDAKSEDVLGSIHQDHRGDESRNRDREAADHLRLQDAKATAVEQPGHHAAGVSTCRGRRAVLARGEQAQR